jgi:hypothetical protein
MEIQALVYRDYRSGQHLNNPGFTDLPLGELCEIKIDYIANYVFAFLSSGFW